MYNINNICGTGDFVLECESSEISMSLLLLILIIVIAFYDSKVC